MNKRIIKFRLMGGLLLLLVLGIVIGRGSFNTGTGTSRKFQITQTFQVDPPPASSEFRIWVPIPSDSSVQRVSLSNIESPVPYQVTTEKEFGNRLLYFKGRQAGKEELNFVITYDVERFEQNGLLKKNQSIEPLSSLERDLYLEPRGLVVINETVRELALKVTAGKTNSLAKAKAVYNYVFNHMSYDKRGKGWGRGDVVYACDVAKGNCTDFHSLFIAMTRSVPIPARFKMGFPLAQEPNGKLKGYHCWAEFFDEERGWVPVDISEAWKNPKRKDYFFGRLDENRFQLSQGRQTHLNPRQKGPAFNWLLLPYVEVNGKPYEKSHNQFEYQSI